VEIIKHFLPEQLLEFFEIEKFEELWEVTTRKMCFNIYTESEYRKYGTNYIRLFLSV
jgi:hypothetical protein